MLDKIFSYKKNLTNERIDLRLLGIKMSFKKKKRHIILGQNNRILINENIEPEKYKLLNIYIKGNNNTIIIDEPISITKNLSINIGRIAGDYTVNNTIVKIGSNCSFEDVNILVTADNSRISIGKDCMLASNVVFRTGELHHLIFDLCSGEYIDKGFEINIGEHVWICDNALIMKKAKVASGCIIGMNSVVTKTFTVENCVIAGNPAKICKENILWMRTEEDLIENSKFYNSYYELRKDTKYNL